MIRLSDFWKVTAVVFFLLAGSVVGETDEPYAEGIVDSQGSIRVPPNFRTDYVMLGAWSIEGDADTGGSTGLHIVYAPPSAVAAYRESGSFPDGTVLVKELFNGHSAELTTGLATRAADVVGHFVMVKDDVGRFTDNPLWGDGWGWSFFPPDDPGRTTSSDYRQDCLACHEPVRDSDLVYVDGYPVLTSN